MGEAFIISLILTFGLVGMSADVIQTTLNQNGIVVESRQADAIYNFSRTHNVDNYADNPYVQQYSNSLNSYRTERNNTGISFNGWLNDATNDFFDDYKILQGGETSPPTYQLPIVGEGGESDYFNQKKYILENGNFFYNTMEIIPGSPFDNFIYNVYLHDISTGKDIKVTGLQMYDYYDTLKASLFDYYAVKDLGNGKAEVIIWESYLDRHGQEVNNTYNKIVDLASPIAVEQAETAELVLNPDGSITYKGQTIFANADGTYTLPDGRVVTLNPDGTLSVVAPGGIVDVVPPVTDDVPLTDVGVIGGAISDLPNSEVGELPPGSLTGDDVIENTIPEIETYEGDLSEFLVDKSIINIFPFCLPWDFVRGIEKLSATPVAPVFDYTFELKSFGISEHIVINFADYDKYFVIVRWLTAMLFFIWLCLISYKLVQGVN